MTMGSGTLCEGRYILYESVKSLSAWTSLRSHSHLLSRRVQLIRSLFAGCVSGAGGGDGQRFEESSGFPRWCLVLKNPPANAGDARDASSIPGLGRSPGVGNVNLLQYSYLENSIEEPGELWSMGLQRVGHDWATKQPQVRSLLNKAFVPAQLLESCLPLYDPMDHNPPGSSVHGIL